MANINPGATSPRLVPSESLWEDGPDSGSTVHVSSAEVTRSWDGNNARRRDFAAVRWAVGSFLC